MENNTYVISSELQADSRFASFHAQKNGDEQVLLKVPKSSYPSPQVLLKLQDEFEILSSLNHPNILHAIKIEPYENSKAIIFTDLKGKSLAEYNEKSALGMEAFFNIAIPLADAIKCIHQHRIIHKNINPSNVIVDGNDKPTLIGFSLATAIPREGQQPNSREIVDADLSYISPEQTGRMNRPLDHRTDLYSLGALFYNLLTGRAPFTGADSMELIHNHIARQPKPPHEISANIPMLISRVIIRLLSKSAEDRYQSAAGLLYDLQRCQEQFKARSIIEFILGERDIHDQFRIPDKIYGRNDELEKLLQIFKSASAGHSELVLISGYSGVGKSRLVSEVKKNISQGKRLFHQWKV